MKIAKTIGLASFALMALLAIGTPSSAMAYEYPAQQQAYPHHHWWQHHHDRPYANPQYGYNNGYYGNNNGYNYNYALRHQNVPQNGEGMIDPRNPNLYWACNSQGNHCHWEPRN